MRLGDPRRATPAGHLRAVMQPRAILSTNLGTARQADDNSWRSAAHWLAWQSGTDSRPRCFYRKSAATQHLPSRRGTCRRSTSTTCRRSETRRSRRVGQRSVLAAPSRSASWHPTRYVEFNDLSCNVRAMSMCHHHDTHHVRGLSVCHMSHTCKGRPRPITSTYVHCRWCSRLAARYSSMRVCYRSTPAMAWSA